MTVWLTSDQHFGHARILEYSGRPFSSVDEMDEAIVARHNEIVRPDDEVYHLGDLSLDERVALRVAPRLHGRKFLIAGNHDACHFCHRRGQSRVRKYVEAGFEWVRMTSSLDGFLMCHLPYRGDTVTAARPNGEERYPEWRPNDEGKWLLHGHVHEAWRQRGRMINVGVDVWNYAPVTLDELKLIRDRGEPAW